MASLIRRQETFLLPSPPVQNPYITHPEQYGLLLTGSTWQLNSSPGPLPMAHHEDLCVCSCYSEELQSLCHSLLRHSCVSPTCFTKIQSLFIKVNLSPPILLSATQYKVNYTHVPEALTLHHATMTSLWTIVPARVRQKSD